jgi:phosphate transport system substrate-binding protein
MNTRAFQLHRAFSSLPLFRLAALVATGCLLTGCPASKPGPEEGSQIIIRGSNTIGEELAPALIAAFKKKHAGTTFDIEFKGTTYGFGALMVGRADIAAASRPVSTNELKLAADRNVTLENAVIGSYAVAVVVNAANPTPKLTPDQVRGIFTGSIQNWKEVGGADRAIQIHIRDQISGTHLGFQEVAMDKQSYALSAKPHISYEDIIKAVAADEGGIGYASFPLATRPGVKGVSIGESAPTLDAVKKGAYPYARTLHLYTDKAKATPIATEFVGFVQSAAGQEILNSLGYLPHP